MYTSRSVEQVKILYLGLTIQNFIIYTYTHVYMCEYLYFAISFITLLPSRLHYLRVIFPRKMSTSLHSSLAPLINSPSK